MSPPDPTASSLARCGYVAPGFGPVAQTFERIFAAGKGGAGFAAYVDGERVVDLWGGLADRRRQLPWGADTLVGIFSGTKGLVATCLLKLIESGRLALDDPVALHWPEFAAEGKDRILVRDVVSHRAGLPGLLTPVSIEQATDDVRMAELLAGQPPLSIEGPCYHAMTFGWLCGELVRRVDGRTVGRFLREEIADQLGLDVWIGLPQRYESRVAVLDAGHPLVDGHGEAPGVGAATDQLAWSIWSNPPRFAHGQLAANERRWRAAEIPATNGVADARSMARLYGCLACGGEIDGIRVLAGETIEAGRQLLSRGDDPTLGVPLAFGTGFELQTSEAVLGPPRDAFGHAGAGGGVHGAWPELRTGFSFAPNLLISLSAGDPRAAELLAALHTSVLGR